MNLFTFLRTNLQKTVEVFDENHVICFVGKQYPLLFFSFLWERLKKKNDRVYMIWDKDTHDYTQLQSLLYTSFLGQEYTIFLKNVSEYSSAEKHQLSLLLRHYKGMHKIILFLQNDDRALYEGNPLVIPDTVEVAQYALLYNFFSGQKSDNQFIEAVIEKQGFITLDQACLLLQYQGVVGRRLTDFYEEWLPRIIEQQQSLFVLSQYFFARQKEQFSVLWHKLVDSYAPEFWIVYWIEQLWQALVFVDYARQGKMAEAKQKTQRLPFSFINKDWRTCSPELLRTAYSFLCALDYDLKNGRASHGLDLFYFRFLYS